MKRYWLRPFADFCAGLTVGEALVVHSTWIILLALIQVALFCTKKRMVSL